MKFFRIKPFSLFFVLALLTWCTACQSEEQPAAEITQPVIQPGPGLGSGAWCEHNEPRRFNLTAISSNDFTTTADLGFSLETASHPYTKDSCMCKVSYFDVIFDPLPPLPARGSIRVKDRFGDTLAFELIEVYDPEQAIRIERPEDFGGPNFDFYIQWLNEEVAAEVDRATGLCIIDNLGADWDDEMVAAPYYEPFLWVQPPSNLGGDTTKTILIPTIMTSPVNN